MNSGSSIDEDVPLKSSSNLPNISDRFINIAASSSASDKLHSEDDGENRLNLGRFAFQSESRSRKPFRSRATSHTPSVVPSERVKKTIQGEHHRWANDFSDADIEKVTKCVSCDIPWTRRLVIAFVA
jgi:hypothetical protein